LISGRTRPDSSTGSAGACPRRAGPTLGVKHRHDRNKSGWFLLVGFIPLIGAVWLFIDLGLIDATPGLNTHGLSPKDLGAAAAA
jgi:hypothetical protein